MNQIVSLGNYISIILNGKSIPFLYSKKNTIFNVYADRIEIIEKTDGKSIIMKSDVDGGNWENDEIGVLDWFQLIEFLSTNTANFSSASGGSDAISEINYSNVLFVDPFHGNNSTALAGRFDLPFQSISAATTMAAAMGGSISTRVLIYIRRGIYTTNVQLTNWVDFYCEPGVVFNGSGSIRDSGVAVTSNFYGFAKFTQRNQTTLFITG